MGFSQLKSPLSGDDGCSTLQEDNNDNGDDSITVLAQSRPSHEV